MSTENNGVGGGISTTKIQNLMVDLNPRVLTDNSLAGCRHLMHINASKRQ